MFWFLQVVCLVHGLQLDEKDLAMSFIVIVFWKTNYSSLPDTYKTIESIVCLVFQIGSSHRKLPFQTRYSSIVINILEKLNWRNF